MAKFVFFALALVALLVCVGAVAGLIASAFHTEVSGGTCLRNAILAAVSAAGLYRLGVSAGKRA